ncbi:MAG: HIT domain-containing protein [Bdellovibrionota bacterium]
MRSIKTGKKKTSKSVSKKSTASGKKTKSKGHAFLGIDEEVWPLERDVLFRPDRLGYVRKLIKPIGCVFCAGTKEKLSFERLSVYSTDHSVVILNKFPYNSGHLLVLPRRHVPDILDLTSAEYKDLMETLRLAVKAIKTVYAPGGYNMGLNQGAVAGAGIPDHLHFHLVPRWAGDLNFFPLIAQTKVVIESLEQSYEKYLNYFNGNK